MNLHLKPDINIAYRITIIALLAGITVAAQLVLAPLANIEIVSLLFILYTINFGAIVIPVIGIFVLIEGLIFGFGFWFINWLYIWYVLAAVVYVFRKTPFALFWATVNGLFGLLFGALCAIPYFFIGGFSMAYAYWINGIYFDLPHCAGNFVLTLILFKPLNNALKKIRYHT